jgi:hypothetical protein
VPSTGSRWRFLWSILLALGALALIAMAVSAVLLSRWSDLRSSSSPQAAQAFHDVRQQVGRWGADADRAYLHIDAAGHVHVDRRLEHEQQADLRALHLLAWDPASQRLLNVGFPWWFVRVKMNDTINLGTFTTALSGDWQHLDLKISTEELRRRGPGIVLDHQRSDNSCVLLWSEPVVE